MSEARRKLLVLLHAHVFRVWREGVVTGPTTGALAEPLAWLQPFTPTSSDGSSSYSTSTCGIRSVFGYFSHPGGYPVLSVLIYISLMDTEQSGYQNAY